MFQRLLFPPCHVRDNVFHGPEACYGILSSVNLINPHVCAKANRTGCDNQAGREAILGRRSPSPANSTNCFKRKGGPIRGRDDQGSSRLLNWLTSYPSTSAHRVGKAFRISLRRPPFYPLARHLAILTSKQSTSACWCLHRYWKLSSLGSSFWLA